MQCLELITVSYEKKVGRYPTGQFYSQKVPCGKCAFCLTNKRSAWMFRIYHEMRTQDHRGWFLTLTYNEKHVRRTVDGRLSLRFKDLQLFIKRIRKAKYYVKYIAVGEYGGDTSRPHYHMLLWTDCPSMSLEKFWSNKKREVHGTVHFGTLTMASAMYTLKYIIQPKQKQVDGLERTRAQFSQGLGLNYLTTSVYNYHADDEDNPIVFSEIDGKKIALPRYYKNKIFTKHAMALEGHKAKEELKKKHDKEVRRLEKLGFKDAKKYLQALRCEQAARIIKTTKFQQYV